jgi:isopentenyl-diphosphate Delta-isomerase
MTKPMDDDEERVVLVDELDREVGVAPKLEAHRAGTLHRAVSVFVFDRDGLLLLQRRAASKYHSASLWANTCCSHPRQGETPHDAARRRLHEEMGIDCALEAAGTFTYQAEVGRGLIEHELDHLFVGRFDGSPSPDPAEVAAWRWGSLDAIEHELSTRPDEFAAWFPAALGAVRAARP